MQDSTITLLNKITPIIIKYDAIAKTTGERFNIFNILAVGSNEVRLHSAFIAELLNPKGNHEMGNCFLHQFLQTLNGLNFSTNLAGHLDKFINGEITVEVEKWVGFIQNEYSEGGSIDIVLTTRNGDAIIIENKIYAGDQKGQLRRYYNYNKKAVLIYLTLDGKKASDESTFNDKCLDEIIHPVCISYKTVIISWLEKCQDLAVNHSLLRGTITQYIYLLKQLTHQTTNHEMQKEIADTVAQNPDFIRSAQEIWANQEAIKLQIIRNLADTLRKDKPLGWDFYIADASSELGLGDSGFGFNKNNQPYWVYFYFRNNYDNLEVGIDWAPNATNEIKAGTLRDNLKNHFADFDVENKLFFDDWICGRSFQPWADASWAEKQSTIPKEIFKTAEMFFNKLESFTS